VSNNKQYPATTLYHHRRANLKFEKSTIDARKIHSLDKLSKCVENHSNQMKQSVNRVDIQLSAILFQNTKGDFLKKFFKIIYPIKSLCTIELYQENVSVDEFERVKDLLNKYCEIIADHRQDIISMMPVEKQPLFSVCCSQEYNVKTFYPKKKQVTLKKEDEGVNTQSTSPIGNDEKQNNKTHPGYTSHANIFHNYKLCEEEERDPGKSIAQIRYIGGSNQHTQGIK